VKDDERRAVARREGWYRLEDTIFRSRSFSAPNRKHQKGNAVAREYSRGITSKEVVARLLRGELRDGGQYTVRVASEHNDVLRRALNIAGYPSVWNKLDWVRAACILRDGDIVVVRLAGGYVKDDVLEDGAEADGIENLRLLFSGEVDALGIAPALDVEDASIRPYVLVVANQLSSGVGREGRLPRTRETEEEGDIALLLVDIGRGVKRKLTEFDGHEVVHNREDTLLHLSGVLGTEDNHLHALEVDLDRRV
jgi:hypothetical protein